MDDNKNVNRQSVKRPAPPPMVDGKKSVAKKPADNVPKAVLIARQEMAEQKAEQQAKGDAAPVASAKAPKAKKPLSPKAKKIVVIASVIAVMVIVAVVLAVVLKDHKPSKKEVVSTTDTRIVVVTDHNGIAVTDENGVPVTLEPQTEVVKVTDANGVPVTNSKGEQVTKVVYKEQKVTIPVAVTDKGGEEVTDKKGNTVTTQVEAVQDPNQQTGNVVLGTVAVPVTDGKGNTAVDNQGNIFTTIVELTSNPVAVKPAEIDWKSSQGGTQADFFSAVDSFKNGDYIALNVTNSKDGNMAEFKDTGFQTPYTVISKYDDDGEVKWRKAIGSKKGNTDLVDVVTCDDGTFYAVGYGKNIGGTTGKGYYDAAIYKFDKNGNVVWYKTFGTSTVDMFYSVALDKDGNIVCVGSVGSNDKDAAGFNKPAAKSAAAIVKYDPNGNVIWKNIVGGNGDSFKGVAINDQGNIFVVGNFASGDLFPVVGMTDSGVCKLDANGKYIGVAPIAGTGNESFQGITACADGGIVVVGKSNSTDKQNPDSMFGGELSSRGGYDAYIIKFEDSLDIEFARPLRGQYNDDLVAVVEKEDGTFVAAGCSNSSTRDLKGITTRGGDDIIIASFGKNGELTWARSFGGTNDESARDICLSPKGGYLIAGRTLSKNIDMVGIAQYVNGKSVGVLAKFPE